MAQIHDSVREAKQRLRAWYARPLGRRLLEFERAELGRILPNLFGYHLLQVGCPTEAYLLDGSRIRHQIVVDDCQPPASLAAFPLTRLYGRADRLPLQGDSVDVVVLPHTLEFEHAPHEVLREVERVLVPEGHVVILGFNPWSLWGLWRLLYRRGRRLPPWCGVFRSILRIKDWLALLGFDTVAVRLYFYRAPLQHAGMMDRSAWIERMGGRWWPYLGGAYMIVAKKRVATLTPIKPRWRPRRRLIQPDVAKPTP